MPTTITAQDLIDSMEFEERQILNVYAVPDDIVPKVCVDFIKTRKKFDALLSQAREEAIKERDSAYTERNRCVAALAKQFPSVVTKTAIEGWDPAWHNCVYVTLPTGQASWHFHDDDSHLFRDIPRGEMKWDGHTTVLTR